MDIVSLRLVGDTKSSPGETLKPTDLAVKETQINGYATHVYDPIEAPAKTTSVTLIVDLSLFSGQDTDRNMILFGYRLSVDGGNTWPHFIECTAGDNAVESGKEPISSQSCALPPDKGKGVLVQPYVGGKKALDVGIKVVFT